MTTNLQKAAKNNFALISVLLGCSIALTTTVVPAHASSKVDSARTATLSPIPQRSITIAQAATFPVQGMKKDNVVRKGYMETSFALESNGTLNAVTKTWTDVKFAGFTGGVVIALTNADGIPIWATEQQRYGVDGKAIPGKKSSRTENWQAQIPPDILSKIKGYAIIQEHTPRNRVFDWIKSPEAQQIVKGVIKYFGEQ